MSIEVINYPIESSYLVHIFTAVGDPGHGKYVCDATSQNTKRKWTIAAGRKLKFQGEEETVSSRNFVSCVKVEVEKIVGVGGWKMWC